MCSACTRELGTGLRLRGEEQRDVSGVVLEQKRDERAEAAAGHDVCTYCIAPEALTRVAKNFSLYRRTFIDMYIPSRRSAYVLLRALGTIWTEMRRSACYGLIDRVVALVERCTGYLYHAVKGLGRLGGLLCTALQC